MHDFKATQFFNQIKGASQSEVDAAFEHLSPSEKIDPAIRFAWKLLRDSYYAALADSHSYQNLIAAGLFDDGVSLEQTIKHEQLFSQQGIPTSFLDRSIKNSNNNKKRAILITTGTFAPVHAGHISMIHSAKLQVEEAGYTVLTGYISPSHQGYVKSKLKDWAVGYSIEDRLIALQTMLAKKENEWLQIALSESYFRTASVNFTEILSGLEQFLHRHYKQYAIDIFYVFGSDNAGFCDAFLEKGNCVCVLRKGYEQKWNFFNEKYKNSNRILFTRKSRTGVSLSSTKVRTLEATKRSLELTKSSIKKKFLIRDDKNFVHEHFVSFMEEYIKKYPNAFAKSSTIKKSITSFYNSVLVKLRLELATDVHEWQVSEVVLSDQQVAFMNFTKSREFVVSLDDCVYGELTLNVSRLFDLFSIRKYPVELSSRPGFPEISDQIKVLMEVKSQRGAASIALVDDDVATGFTKNTLLELFQKNGVEVTFSSLMESLDKPDEIADFRDFILGCKSAGLVVEYAGTISRVPYIFPLVRLQDRASLSFRSALQLSVHLWKLNIDFYSTVFPQATLEELLDNQGEIFILLGFKKTAKVLDVCRQYLEFTQHALDQLV